MLTSHLPIDCENKVTENVKHKSQQADSSSKASLASNPEYIFAQARMLRKMPVPRLKPMISLAAQWIEYIKNIHPCIPFKDNKQIDDYLEGAILIISVIEDPILLQATISFFNKNLESAHRLKLGTFTHWERFYKLCVERLGRQNKLRLSQKLLDNWATRMQPEGCDLKEAKALLACRRVRQNASLRFQAEITALGRIKQRYLEGADEVQRLVKAGVLSPDDLKAYTESQAILLGRAWELSRSYALRGWKVGLHGQSGYNSVMVDLINQHPGANPLWLRLRELSYKKNHTIAELRRECNSDDLGDYWLADSLLSLSAWLKDTTRAESFVDFVTRNACCIKLGSKHCRNKTDFINQKCQHGTSCNGDCLNLLNNLNERVKDIAERRQKIAPDGVAYMVCVRPKAFNKLFYLCRPCGFYTSGPLERAPKPSEILEKGPPGVDKSIQYRAHAQLISRRQQQRDVRVIRLSSLDPAIEAQFELEIKQIYRILQIYDKLHIHLPPENREELANDLTTVETMAEIDEMESNWKNFIADNYLQTIRQHAVR